MKALIVDDFEINRELLTFFLEGRAVVVSAESGEEALALVKDSLQAGAYFDLICMDIRMPGMDGHESLKNIRDLEAAYGSEVRAKVFMVTASNSPQDMIDALVVGGCDDYITKPLMMKSFLELLRKHGLS